MNDRSPSIVATSMLLMFLAGAAVDARAQGGGLEAPMNPIGRTETAPSRCVQCPAADAKDLDMRRVVDRSAPEYQGGHRAVAGPEMEPSATATLGLAGGQLPIALPLP